MNGVRFRATARRLTQDQRMVVRQEVGTRLAQYAVGFPHVTVSLRAGFWHRRFPLSRSKTRTPWPRPPCSGSPASCSPISEPDPKAAPSPALPSRPRGGQSVQEVHNHDTVLIAFQQNLVGNRPDVHRGRSIVRIVLLPLRMFRRLAQERMVHSDSASIAK